MIKGVDLQGVVTSLKAWQKRMGREVPGVHPDDRPYLDGSVRVLSSVWYPLETFNRLLVQAHKYVYGGTEAAMIQMGRDAAAHAYGGVHAIFIKEGDLAGTIRSFGLQWRQHFNFGSLEIEDIPGGVSIRFNGFRDIIKVHGVLHVGWFLQVAEMVGVSNPRCRIVSAPWLAGGDLTLELVVDKGAQALSARDS